MPNVNKVILIGHIAKDLELQHTKGGDALLNFVIAVNREYTNKSSGERVKEVDFIDITAWKKPAEIINQYCSKGDPIYVEGRLDQQKWETPEGQKRSKICVILESFQFLKTKGKKESQQDSSSEYEDQEAPPF